MKLPTACLLLGTYWLVLLSYLPSYGLYSPLGLLGLVLALLLLLFQRPTGEAQAAELLPFGFVGAVFTVALAIMYHGAFWQNRPGLCPIGIYAHTDAYALASKSLLAAAAALVALYAPDSHRLCRAPGITGVLLAQLVRHKFHFLLFAALALRILLILDHPSPNIDVHVFMNGGADALLAGVNPYTAVFPQPGGPDLTCYGYFPFSLLLTAPLRLLLGDVRYALAFADWFAALLLVGTVTVPARSASSASSEIRAPCLSRLAELLAVMFLFNPMSSVIVGQSWVEPLMVLGIALFAFFAARSRWTPAAAGLALVAGVKLYGVILLPFLFRVGGRRRGVRLALVAGVVLGLAMLPFATWNWRAFLQDTVAYHLLQSPRPDALTLHSLLHRLWGVGIPFPVFALLAGLGSCWFFWRQKCEAADYLRSAAGVLLLVFLTAKQAFLNYYYLLSAIILFELALRLATRQSRSLGPPPGS